MTTQNTYHINVDPPTSTHQSALRILKTRDGRQFVGKMKNAKVKNWEGQFRAELRRHTPKFPIPAHQPVRVIVALFYTPPKCRKCTDISWKVTKPDADNVVKVILDSLVAERFIQSDQQVCDLRVLKMEWAKGGFMEILIDSDPAPFLSV